MKLSQLGEFGLIDRIAERETKLSSTVVGIGDDAAVLELPTSNIKLQNKTLNAKYQLITTDTFIENVHFKLTNNSFYKLGYKALAANISDIAAMGGWPTHALITIGAPGTMDVKAIDELYRGINSLASKFKIDIVGGDTIRSPREVVVSITLLGEVEKDNLLLRSTAKIGDAILVTGDFGGPAAEKYDSRKLKVESRIRESRIIAKSRMATSMIDSSDGLVRSVIEICKASKVSARIWEDKVPVAKGATLDQALYGGEEYELVFTVSKGRVERVVGSLGGSAKTKISIVGEIVGKKRGVKLVDVHGRIHALKSGGYEHFR